MSDRDRLNSRPGDRGELTEADIRKMIFERYSDAMRGKEALLGPNMEQYAQKLERTEGLSRLDAIEASREWWLEPHEIVEHERAVRAVRRLLGTSIAPFTDVEIAAERAKCEAQPSVLRDQASGREPQQAAKPRGQEPEPSMDELLKKGASGDPRAAAMAFSKQV